MDKQSGIEQIRAACKNIAVELVRIHPALPALGDKETQDQLYKVLYELTKQVENIKKRLAKLEARDDSTVL